MLFSSAQANSIIKHSHITIKPTKKIRVKQSSKHRYQRKTGIAAVNAANQQALRRPKSNSYINSIMNFTYMPGALYKIYCAPLSVTDLQFQLGEKIISVAAGDTFRWEVSKTFSGSEDNQIEHLLIKPVESNLTNSLVVTTSFRTYHLLLHSTQHTYMAVVTWHYPSSRSLVKKYRNMTTVRNYLSKGLRLTKLDFNYKSYLLRGNQQPSWTPTTIFNDGQKTYIKFPKNMQEAPTLFLGDRNNFKAANYRVKGNYYIIDHVVQQMQLCLGLRSSPVIQIIHNGR
jgi:type IV secretion system protein VirB9